MGSAEFLKNGPVPENWFLKNGLPGIFSPNSVSDSGFSTLFPAGQRFGNGRTRGFISCPDS